MDGQQRRPIVSSNLVWPNGLAIDIQSQSLYWADAMLDKIESSNADGTNRHVLTTIGIFHPFSLTVHEAQLYWSDWEMDVILTGSSDIYLNARLLARLNGSRPMGIKAVSSANQPSGTIVDTQVRGQKFPRNCLIILRWLHPGTFPRKPPKELFINLFQWRRVIYLIR